MGDINLLFEILQELKQEEESLIRDLRIADIICRLENLLGA